MVIMNSNLSARAIRGENVVKEIDATQAEKSRDVAYHWLSRMKQARQMVRNDDHM